jgi:hypothetical protein
MREGIRTGSPDAARNHQNAHYHEMTRSRSGSRRRQFTHWNHQITHWNYQIIPILYWNHQIIPPDHAVESPLRLIYTSEPTSAADPATGYTKPGLAKSADQRIIEAGCVSVGIMKNLHISSSSFVLNPPFDVAMIMHLQCSQTARTVKILSPSLQNVNDAPVLLSTFPPRSPNWRMPRSRQA